MANGIWEFHTIFPLKYCRKYATIYLQGVFFFYIRLALPHRSHRLYNVGILGWGTASLKSKIHTIKYILRGVYSLHWISNTPSRSVCECGEIMAFDDNSNNDITGNSCRPWRSRMWACNSTSSNRSYTHNTDRLRLPRSLESRIQQSNNPTLFIVKFGWLKWNPLVLDTIFFLFVFSLFLILSLSFVSFAY